MDRSRSFRIGTGEVSRPFEQSRNIVPRGFKRAVEVFDELTCELKSEIAEVGDELGPASNLAITLELPSLISVCVSGGGGGTGCITFCPRSERRKFKLRLTLA